ncbi:MAG: Ig-like domain-containing protein [Treponema sp.]|jgi:hypothetical protein|nr:Ig-like domain-containing protein [Treponema sp.]
MFRRLIDPALFYTVLLAACSVILPLSCGFMDLRPVSLDVYPSEPDTVLKDSRTPLVFRFDTEMDRNGAEALVNVAFNGGRVEGDLSWEGNTLYYRPVEGWSPGRPYGLNLSGTADTLDGRELRIARYIPFFAVSREALPMLVRFSPDDGGVVGLSAEEGCTVELFFSEPMDRASVERTFTVDGLDNFSFIWAEEDRLLSVRFSGTLKPWTAYHWTISDKALDKRGAPLAKAVSAQFITGKDTLLPKPVDVYPMLFSNGKWLPTGGVLETDLGSAQGIGVEFNKEMDEESMLRSLRFEPALSGRGEFLSPVSFVFIPDKDPEPETVYTLVISADTKDRYGLKIGADYERPFTADLPYLEFLSIAADGGNTLQGNAIGAVLQVPVEEAQDGMIGLDIGFSHLFTEEAMLDAAFRIVLEVFFPGTLNPVSLRSARWSDGGLRLEWEGLEAGKPGEVHYYKLSVPGGRTGITDGKGSYLKEDVTIYLEGVNK